MDWEIVLFSAFTAIGFVEYIKGFFKDAPGVIWRVSMPIVCLVMGVVFTLSPDFVQTGLVVVAVVQLGYDIIIDTVKNKLKGL